jgi:hypothetical protein
MGFEAAGLFILGTRLSVNQEHGKQDPLYTTTTAS